MPESLLLEIIQVNSTKTTVDSEEYYLLKAKVLETVEADKKANSGAYAKEDEIWFRGFESDGSIRQNKTKVALFEEDAKLNNQWQGKKVRILAPTFSSYNDEDLSKTQKKMPRGLMLEILQVTDTKKTLSNIVFYVLKAKVLKMVEANSTVPKEASSAYAKDEEIYFAGLKTDGGIRQSIDYKIDLFKELVAQDWADKTITIACEHKGYETVPSDGKTVTEHIIMPEKTVLQVQEVQTAVVNNFHYSKVVADIALKMQDTENKIIPNKEWKKGEPFWIQLTDQDGYVPLTTNGNELYTDSTPPPEPKTNKLTFYSLYMHLLPYEEYPTKEGEVSRKAKITVDKLMAYDKIIDNTDTKSLGTIPKDTLIIIEETKEDEDSKYNYAKVKTVDDDVKLTCTSIVEEKNEKGEVIKKTEKTEEIVPPKEGFWIIFKEKKANSSDWSANAEELPTPKREYPSYWANQVTAEVSAAILNARKAPAAGSNVAGDIYGVQLTKGDQVTYEKANVKQLMIGKNTYDMAECKLVTPKKQFTEKGITTFWASVTNNSMTTLKAEPTSFEKVDKDHFVAISAGDPIGYLGLYQVPNQDAKGMSKKQVHIEVFTIEEEAALQKFLDNEAGLTIGRQYIKIIKDTALEKKSPYKEDQVNTKLNDEWKDKQIELLASGLDSYTSDQCNTTDKKAMPQGLKLAIVQVKTSVQKLNNVDYYLTEAKVLEDIAEDTKAKTSAYKKDEVIWFAAFTADEKITYSNGGKTNIFKDTTPTSNERSATEPTSESIKKLKEDYYTVQYDHIIAPEEAILKEGYYKVTLYENNKYITGYIPEAKIKEKISQYALDKLGFKIIKEESDSSGAVTAEMVDGFIDQSNITPFFQEICNEIAPKENDGSKKELSLAELRSALQNPRFSNKWSKLIAYHPTEWKVAGDDAKWKRLEDKDMLPGDENKALRDHEKKRITNLVFWDNVPDLANQTQAHHFHPVAFVDYMSHMDIGIYHIYSTGKITKENCSINNTHFSYYYYDTEGNVHTVHEKIEAIKIKQRENGSHDNYVASTVIEHQKNLSEPCVEGTITERKIYDNGDEHIFITAASDNVNLKQRVICKNGDVYEYGKPGEGKDKPDIWIFYAKTIPEKDTIIFKMPELNYIKNDITISYSFKDTERKYTHPDTFAGFIGVLAEIGFALVSAGSSFITGSSFPSVAHTNGASIDTAYLFNLKKDQLVIDAAVKFHFKQVIAGAKTKKVTTDLGTPNQKTTTVTTYFNNLKNAHAYKSDHNGHLHFGSIRIPNPEK